MALFPEPSIQTAILAVWGKLQRALFLEALSRFPLAFHQAAASFVLKLNTARANHGVK